MQPTPPDWLLLDEYRILAPGELAEMCGMDAADIDELVEYGALERVANADAVSGFSAVLVAPLREAVRLRADYDLDLFTVGVLLGYLRRIAQLEREVRSLRAHLGQSHQLLPREGPGTWREPHA